jgi:diguanylate cyclase (GGDEF)-like protein/PAS domain S-box-containing protein
MTTRRSASEQPAATSPQQTSAGTKCRFVSSSPLRGEDSAARFSFFAKIDLAALGGGDFGPRVRPTEDHPHPTTTLLRKAVVVLPAQAPQGGGGENRQFQHGLSTKRNWCTKRNWFAAFLKPLRLAALAICMLTAYVSLDAPPARAAVQTITINPDLDRIDITALGEMVEPRGDNLQIEAAAAADGITSRMAVRAANPGSNPSWIAFALTNRSDKPVERWLTSERYASVGAGIMWPNLDTRRIEAITPSLGFVPERVKSDSADIFRITLAPGQTITYVAEFASERHTRVYLWKPNEYEAKYRDRQLFHGVLLGITGLLAIFLTAVFAANHKAIFPSTALVTWCVLAYLCVDFGFFHKLFQLRPEDNGVYRAATESAVAASLVVFLHTFLRLGAWHSFVRMLITVWMIAQFSLIAVALVSPQLAATFARLSFLAIGTIGALLTLFLAIRGQDRALALVPTWLLFLVWIFAAGVTLTGRLGGEIASSGLAAGLVLFVVLVGFTVIQFAFRSLEPLYGAAPSELQARSQAIESAGAAIWEWNARRDDIKVSPLVELSLGLQAGELSAKFDDFAKHLHSADKERFRLLLWGVNEKNGGTIRTDFRMRHTDGSYLWFELEAASVASNERRAVRCVGLMRDITDAKRATDRLMHDAVHDSLTSLPNRELFVDRLSVAFTRAKTEDSVQPTLIFIDIDKFKSVNSSFGLIVGDSLLLTVARRLARHLAAQDTLARVGGDQFAILLIAQQDPQDLHMLTERIRRSLRAPIKISGQEIVLTASCGVAVYDSLQASPQDLLKEAEIAMTAPSARAPTRSSCSNRPCGPSATTASPSRAICASPSTANSCAYCTSRSSTCRPRSSRGSRPWCGGTIRNSGCSTRPNSSRSPRRAT